MNITCLHTPVLFGLCLRASPLVEADERVLCYASLTEATDLPGERRWQTALEKSTAYVLTRASQGVDHDTLRAGSLRIPTPPASATGWPGEIRFKEGRVCVKGVVSRGTGPMPQQATEWWRSMTALTPPAVRSGYRSTREASTATREISRAFYQAAE